MLFTYMVCVKSYAQSPYKASVGGAVYGIALGPSFKSFFTDKVAFQTDIFFKGTITGSKKDNFVLYFVLETDLNIMYQKKLKDKLFGFIGGGVSHGYTFSENGKFGVNTIGGLEFVFKKIPLSIQLDLRPGYGLLYNVNNNPIPEDFFSSELKTPWSHFDWTIAFILRYTFKEK